MTSWTTLHTCTYPHPHPHPLSDSHLGSQLKEIVGLGLSRAVKGPGGGCSRAQMTEMLPGTWTVLSVALVGRGTGKRSGLWNTYSCVCLRVHSHTHTFISTCSHPHSPPHTHTCVHTHICVYLQEARGHTTQILLSPPWLP